MDDAPAKRRSMELPGGLSNVRASLDLLGDGVGRHGGHAAHSHTSRLSIATQQTGDDDLELQRAALEKASCTSRHHRGAATPPLSAQCHVAHSRRPRVAAPQAFSSKLATGQAVMFRGADGWQVITMRKMKSVNAQALLDKVAEHGGQADAQAEPFLKLMRDRLRR